MKIKKIKIQGYGKLSNLELKLKDGLNIIHGSNESGKSTIRSFIYNMFFAGTIPSSRRAIYTEEYNSYIPWGGLNYEGSMEIDVDKESFHLYRNFTKGSERFSIINVRTGEDAKDFFNVDESKKVEKIDSEFFGISEGTIRKNFTIEPLYSEINMGISSDIKDRLNNKISTNEDSISLDKLIDNIDLANNTKLLKKEYKDLSAEIKDLELKLKHSNIKLEYNIDFDYLDELTDKIEALEDEYNSILGDKLQGSKSLDYDSKSSIEGEYNYLQGKLNNLNIGSLSNTEVNEIKEALKNRTRLTKEIEQLEGKDTKDGLRMAPLLLLSPVAPIYSYFFVRDKFIYALAFGVLLIIGAMYNYFTSNSTKSKLMKSYAELDTVQSLLLNYNIDVDLMDEELFNREISEKRFLEDRIAEIEKTYSPEINYREDRLDESFIKLKDSLEAFKLERAGLIERIRINDEAYKDDLEAREELSLLTDNSLEVKENIDLIEESKVILRRLSKDKFINQASHISDLGGRYLNKLTAGKYSNILINPDGNILIKDVAAGEYIDVSNLSKGTIDQVYLAHRLAIIESLELDFPLFIDDGLVLYDDERNLHAIALLAELSKSRQVLLFTSHERDIEHINRQGIDYNYIKLGV